jgi:hypothetical protein
MLPFGERKREMDTLSDNEQPLHAGGSGRQGVKQRLPAQERQRREEFARDLFAHHPHMSITEAQARTQEKFGEPLSYTSLSAIKAAYRLVKGIPPAPKPSWRPPAYDPNSPVPFVDIERVKEKLRAMLLKGLSPQQRSPLSKIGRQLVAPGSPWFDKDFAAEMEHNAPPWFFVGKRQVLLDMARRGEPRPSRASKDQVLRALGQQLSALVTKTSTSYDEDFDKEIRALRPDWFKKNGGDDGE